LYDRHSITATGVDETVNWNLKDPEGLMTNDSVTVALMRQLDLPVIATADADFNNVSGLRVYQPEDIS
jgi:predicted nucleic acid-binding protein